MRHRIKGLLTAAALLCGFLGGCSEHQVVTENRNITEITLSWWGNDARTEYTLEAVQQFEALHPDIKVNCSYSEWSGYEARSRVQMVSDTEADVMQINFGWLSEYSQDGTGYYDLSQVEDTLDLSNFTEPMLDYGRKNGVLNAVPIAMNAETIYINKTIYDKYGLDVPETWDDYFAAAAVMQKDGVYPLSGVAKSVWLYTLTYAEQMTGKPFLRDDGSLNFNAHQLRIMLEFYDRMVEEKVIPQVEYYDRLNIEKGVYAGGIAWVSDAKNYFGGAADKGYEIVIADYTAKPGMKHGDGWYAKPATMYAISKNTEHPTESAMLLDFLLNSPEMAKLQGVEKGIPLSSAARQTLAEEGMLQGLQYQASLKMEENTELSKMNAFVENSGLIDAFVEACNLVLYEKATSEEASQELYRTIRKDYT